jgi:branched-chain amino acid aminotransferase
MRGVALIDGAAFPVEEARVPVLDRGFLYGDSVYEVVRTYDGRPFALRPHLERLARSAELVDLVMPLPVADLEDEMRRGLELAGPGEWYARLIITRGSGEIGLDPALATSPRRVLILLPLRPFPQDLRDNGVGVALVATGRGGDAGLAAGAKTGNYLDNIMSLRHARAAGAFEAVMVGADGTIGEATTSNVFVVKGREIRTPPLASGILAGITRGEIIALCAAFGQPVIEAPLWPHDLTGADEAFLTSTLKEVLPIVRVDGVAVANGRPGPITLDIAARFRERVSRSDG